MKILLLNPPFHPRFSRSQRSPGVTKSGTFYYPLWLAYAAGVLEQQGRKVRLLDAPAAGLSREQCYAEAAAWKPDLIVLDTSTPSIHNDLEIARELKQRQDTPLVLVGTHVSVLAEAVLAANPAIDFIARKEYEHTLAELARVLEQAGDPGKVRGLTGRWRGRLFHAPDRPGCPDLDSLPFVSRVYQEHLPYRNYRYSITRHPVITILTGRGCPHQCQFCLYPQTFSGHKYRCRSVANVVEEFEYIREAFPDVREVFIEDDTFTVDHGRVEAFCDALLRKKIKLAWTANARADLDLALLKKMKAAGLRLLCVGFESFDPEVIRNVRKNLRMEQVRQFVKSAVQANVMIHGCFIFGNPGDTLTTFAATLKFAKTLPLSSAQFFPVMPYPGTGLYADLKQQGCLRTEDYSQWVDEKGFHNCVVQYPHLSSETILAACNQAKLRFHLRPSYLGHKFLEILRQPGELNRNVQSMVTLLRNSFRGRKGREGKAAC
jgi:radical SAM superfamily enzyme YgiQ (UPF0313 family)